MYYRKQENNKWQRHLSRIVLYFIVYLIGFFYIEQREVDIHIIHTVLDDRIPFCSYFIIPYVMWFGYVAVTIVWFAVFASKKNEYYQLSGTICSGASLFLLISFFYPNGQNLRPDLTGGDIWTTAVQILYQIDTPTNILPSLHVFFSIACCIAILKNDTIRKHRIVRLFSVVLSILIILSTMFLKQHSVIDVALALVFNVFAYWLFYVWLPSHRRTKAKDNILYDI